MDDLLRAKERLLVGDVTCVLWGGGEVLTSAERGVKPLVLWLLEGRQLSGFSAADKVVGKATAFLYQKLGVCAVYAPVMSQGAVEVLRRAGIACRYDTLAEAILNRRRDGFCPMETAVREIEELEPAIHAILAKYRQMNP